MGKCADCQSPVTDETPGFVCGDCAIRRTVRGAEFLAERRQQRAQETAERATAAEGPAMPPASP